jgi:hypothetical protein
MEALKFKEAVADLLKVKPEKRDQIDKNILPGAPSFAQQRVGEIRPLGNHQVKITSVRA